MRLHRLEVEAFGPFATRQVVDFDAVAADGLFLLHGPTGGGKTSVLDAVCFALFGALPGARREGRPRLRSDHAEPTAVPQVVLELTVAGRRLEVTRSPEWQRPKKRGAGTTRQPASADVRELVDGEWRVLVARRSDEAALLLHGLLGLGLEQFTKVVLLPQGEFAAFLRAGAQQRADLLSRLFDIDRYAGAEAWLREHRQQLARQVAEVDAERDALVARAQQAALPVVGAVAGSAGSPSELALADPPGPAWVEALTSTVAAAVASARRADTVAQQRGEAALAAYRDAERLAERLARRANLLATLARLDRDDDRHRDAVGRRDAARRAQRLSVVLTPLAGAEGALDAADQRLRRRLAALPADVAGDLTPQLAQSSPGAAQHVADRLERLRALRVSELARLDDAQTQDDTLRRLRRECTDLETEVAQCEQDVADLSAQLPEARAALAALREQHDGLVAAAAGVEAARRARDAAQAVERAAAELAACTAELAARTDERQAAREAEHAARTRLLDVRERRLRGMAAALAADLADGDPCPVCGSVEHPQPAATDSDHVDEREEQRAGRQADAAREAREAADAALADVAQRHAALSAVAGEVPVKVARDVVAQRERELLGAEQAVAELAACRRRLAAAETQCDSSARALGEAERRRSDLAGRLALLRTQREEVATALAGVLQGSDDLAARRTLVAAEHAALAAGLEAARSLAAAVGRVDDLRTAATRAAAELGFADLDAAREAWLDDGALAALDEAVREHERARADARAVLATPELRDLGSMAVPDLDAARTEAEHAAARCDETVRQLAVAEQAHTALRALAVALREHDDVHRELRLRHQQVDDLSRCVDGTGGGNVRRMRLSAFVLAARLEEVAAAASERLLAMSDGRYTLTHSDDLARGGARSGLGLQVLDSWTGVARDPSTLSGGESFVASVALALGLADVVQAEAGGSDIETLFVDEGFGSLDDDTLEEVMTVLDGLRNGGRTVGVVSHVADLRSRIHSQLELVKTRTGSRILQHGLEPRRAAG